MTGATRRGRVLARRFLPHRPMGSWMRGIDLASLLIRAADSTETGLRGLPRQLRRVARYSLARLTAGLLWRSAAAVTGIGMAAALVTGLSAEGSAPRLAGTLQPEPASTVRDVRQQPRLAVTVPIEWRAVDGVAPRISLHAPDLAGLTPRLVSREAEGGRSLEDTVSFGDVAERRGHLTLRVRTGPAAAVPPGPSTVHFIRQAAEQGLSVDRKGLVHTIGTGWGSLDLAEIVLSDGNAGRACLAFRSTGGQGAALSGWWCPPEGGVADVAALRCTIDRLEIDGLARTAPPSCVAERVAPPRPVRSAVNERDKRERTR